MSSGKRVCNIKDTLEVLKHLLNIQGTVRNKIVDNFIDAESLELLFIENSVAEGIKSKLLEKLDYSLTLPENALGAEVRDHLVKLQNLFGTFNEMYDEALLELEKSKILLETVTEKVDEALAKEYPVTKGKKRKLNVKVRIDKEELTILDAKKKLAIAKFELSQAKSKVNELKSAISATRSILAWDRQELSES